MTTETGINLTASQIKFFDELHADKQGVEATLRVALNYHANCINQIVKRERTMWDEIAKANGLDLTTGNGYRIDSSGGVARVVKMTDQERREVESK